MMFLANSGGGKSGGGGGSSSSGFSLFGGKQKDPAELAKEWKRNLQKEMRKIDRDITDIRRQEEKSVKECKALAKAGRMNAVKVLAKVQKIINSISQVE